MTHTNHRQGTCDNLNSDFVVLGFPGRAFTDLESVMNQYKEIGSHHGPVNLPEGKSLHTLVYESQDKITRLLSDLIDANLGLSITIAGLYELVNESCRLNNLTPHTVCQSLGFWGNTSILPRQRILEITTMCGHDRISPELVLHLAGEIQHNGLPAEEASNLMGKLCLCNAFNRYRSTELLRNLSSDLNQGIVGNLQPAIAPGTASEKDFGIVIDKAGCIGCMDCIRYCPVNAIAETPEGDCVLINPEICTECGICMQSGVCPVNAIAAKDLEWPRTVRGKFHNMYAPYRGVAILASTGSPSLVSHEGHIYNSFSHRTELTNDVTGLIKRGETVVSIELGRPHSGVTFKDVQKCIHALVPSGFKVEKETPLYELVDDRCNCNLKREILNERTGRVILSVTVPHSGIADTLMILRQIEKEVETVFAVNLVSLVNSDGTITATEVCRSIGIEPAPHCKTNVGLGRPLAKL